MKAIAILIVIMTGCAIDAPIAIATSGQDLQCYPCDPDNPGGGDVPTGGGGGGGGGAGSADACAAFHCLHDVDCRTGDRLSVCGSRAVCIVWTTGGQTDGSCWQ